MSRKLLFILKNGAIHVISDHVQHQVEVLSRRFDCELWGPGSIEVDRVEGPGSRIRIVRQPEPAPRLEQIRYVLRLVARIRQLRKVYGSQMAILAHDPLKSGLIGVLLAWVARAPLIVEINGVYSNIDNFVSEGASDDDRERAQRKIALLRRIATFVLKRARGVRLLFDGQLDGFVELDPRIVRRTFFDLTPLARFTDQGEQPVVVFVGYPFHTKGVDILIRAFEQVSADYPQWRLLLIGHDLQRQVEQLTRHPQVQVMKATSGMELAKYVNTAGIFVLPSRSEAMGRVLLEAAAASKPRIAARVGGTFTVIEHGKDGLLFAKEDVPALAEQLRQLMGSEQLRRQYGQAARRRVETEFSDAVYLERVSELVEAACG